MTSLRQFFSLFTLMLLACLGLANQALGSDPLPSWNEGPNKQAIVEFVNRTTDPANPDFVPAAQRIATFDNDGTLWVEHPMYTQLTFALDQVKAMGHNARSGSPPSHSRPCWRAT